MPGVLLALLGGVDVVTFNAKQLGQLGNCSNLDLLKFVGRTQGVVDWKDDGDARVERQRSQGGELFRLLTAQGFQGVL